METVSIEIAEEVFGKNFVGPKQLSKVSKRLNISSQFDRIPKINFSKKQLQKFAKNFILILGVPLNKRGEPLTLCAMRSFFGLNPNKKEPCFYNQDWYLNEPFAKNKTLENKWYLVGKDILGKSRGMNPEKAKITFPDAILISFTFFAFYFLNRKILWEKDFVWCNDLDSSGDRIYVGRYRDPSGINKNGFNIHRHLSIKKNYGLINIYQ